MIGGGVHAGPNAVLAFKREGYHKTDFSLRDFTDTMTYSGFWKLARKNLREGLMEIRRSLSKALFVKSLQRLIPEITAADLVPSHAGVPGDDSGRQRRHGRNPASAAAAVASACAFMSAARADELRAERDMLLIADFVIPEQAP